MYWKICFGFVLVFQLSLQAAAAAVINVNPGGPGRLHRAEAPLVSFVPDLWWGAVPGVDRYEIQIMEISAGGTLRVAHTRTGIAGASYTIPAGVLAPKKTYFWVVKPANVAQQATNFTAMYFRTGPGSPSPGTATAPGPVLSTLTPVLEWQVVPKVVTYQLAIFHMFGYNPDPTKPSYENPAVFRQGTAETSLAVPPGILKPGSNYMWVVATAARESRFSFQYYFRTTPEPLRTGLPQQVNLVVGNGIGFKVLGGAKPYNIYEDHANIARAFRQGQNPGGEDFQINALSPGTTHVVIGDKSDQRIRITVIVTPK